MNSAMIKNKWVSWTFMATKKLCNFIYLIIKSKKRPWNYICKYTYFEKENDNVYRPMHV